jgi:AraC family ethanolamine operon transcriptional activator
MRTDEPWELAASGPFGYAAFGVDRRALDVVETQLAGGEPRRVPSGNAILRRIHAEWLGDRVRLLLRALAPVRPDPVALDAASSQLLLLAARLGSIGAGASNERPAPPSQRRAAVRRVEEWLDAQPGERASIPALCNVAGVSERTLEYAFRERLGMTPARYLKIRRLNFVRRELETAAPQGASVTAIALRSGFFDLGRFAGEYRALFGELPSETLRRVAARRGERIARSARDLPEGSAGAARTAPPV